MVYHCFMVFGSAALFIIAPLSTFLCVNQFSLFLPLFIYMIEELSLLALIFFPSFNSTRFLSILVLFSPFLTSETELSLLINPSFYSFDVLYSLFISYVRCFFLQRSLSLFPAKTFYFFALACNTNFR